MTAAMELPPLSLAVVQSDAEMLHAPGYELSGFLLGTGRWMVETFAEREIETLLTEASRFDCIVFGFNSILHSERIQRALSRGLPDTGIAVLHQLRQEGFSFLKGDLELRVHELSASRSPASTPRAVEGVPDVLLHWPREPLGAVDAEGHLTVEAEALCVLELPQSTAWEPVLTVSTDDGSAAPVVARTQLTRHERMAVCTLLLEPNREPVHGNLLENLVSFCAGARPEVAIVHEGGVHSQASRIIMRKLRLQGCRAVAMEASSLDDLSLQRWPLSVADRLLTTGDVKLDLAAPSIERWLRCGGTIVTSDERRGLLFHHGATDALWVAERWGAWFHRIEESDWLGSVGAYVRSSGGRKHAPTPEVKKGSIYRTRAVLRVLSAFKEPHARVPLRRLGLRARSDYRDAVAALLDQRLEGRDSCEETVATTVAALDLDRLVGGDVLDPAHRERIVSWLLRRFERATLEDKLDIVRLLGLREDERAGSKLDDLRDERIWIADGSRPHSPVLVTRLAEACVACELDCGVRINGTLLATLDRAPLLSAEFLAAMSAYAARFGTSQSVDPDGAGTDRAISTLQRHGFLAGRPHPDEHPQARAGQLEAVCAEALALLAYFALEPTPTHAIHSGSAGFPEALIQPTLEQTARVREGAAQARLQIEDVQRQLARFRGVLGAIALVASLATAVGILVIWGFGPDTIPFAIAGGSALFVLLAALLEHERLLAERLRRLVRGLGDGIAGLFSTATDLFKQGEDGDRR